MKDYFLKTDPNLERMIAHYKKPEPKPEPCTDVAQVDTSEETTEELSPPYRKPDTFLLGVGFLFVLNALVFIAMGKPELIGELAGTLAVIAMVIAFWPTRI